MIEAARAALEARLGGALALLERMVDTNSHTSNVAGVDAVGAMLADALRETALELHSVPGSDVGAQLCFETERAASTPPILLIGHHDTVFPKGSFEGFVREGDIARGPGVLDMKGGLTVVVAALWALHDLNVLPELSLRFVSVSDEEVGSPHSQVWLRELAQNARCALVFEAGRAGDAIITARRGSGSAVLTAHGRAAHAGNALEQGRNAIWALSRCIDKLQSAQHSVPGASLSVGLVRGGTARNSVPAEAACEVDLRFSDPHGEARMIALIEDACASHGVSDVQVGAQVVVARKPWARSEGSVELCRRYGAEQEAAGLSFAEAQRIGGGSDANTVAALGVPCIDGLGPRGKGFHTHDEYIEVPSLALKAEALLRFLLRMRSQE